MALDQPLRSSRQRIRRAGGPASSNAAQSASSGGRRLLVHAAGVDGGRDVLPTLWHRRRGAVFAHLPARPRPASFIAAMAWGSEASTRAAQVFPLLGPDYPLESAAAAVASALLTETFGFASGLVGYARRDLVDWAVAREILAVSVPGALVGAVCAPSLAGDAQLLRAVYALLMLSLATDLARRDRAAPPPGDKLTDGAATAGGAFLTGLLGVGVGEVVLPQLSRDRPLPRAAGTSVAVVAGTAAAAAVTQVAELDATQVPWELVRYTIPGVILGGQIAPRLAGRLEDRQIERAAAALFAVVGAAFALKAATG
jgi:hypothetical protein